VAARIEYLDFELEISRSDDRYEVRARSVGGEAACEVAVPFTSAALREASVERVRRAVEGLRTRRVEDDTQRLVRDFGETLFDAVMPQGIETSFRRTKDEARRTGKGVRLKLCIDAPELTSLPWEFLYDPLETTYLAHSARNAVVRYIDVPQPVVPLAVEPPLRILGMIPAPDDMERLDVANEKLRIETALRTQIESGAVWLHWLEGQTWEAIEEESWAKEPWHIFHFIGHGRYDAEKDEGQVVLAHDDGKAHFLRASDLGSLLADFNSLRLVVLNACEGAKGGTNDILSSTGSILVRAGVPAVVAMQYEITDEAAIEFARKFYSSIAAERPVEAAVAQARTAIRMKRADTFEWATPVLYTHAAEGLLFRTSRRDGQRGEQASSPGAGDWSETVRNRRPEAAVNPPVASEMSAPAQEPQPVPDVETPAAEEEDAVVATPAVEATPAAVPAALLDADDAADDAAVATGPEVTTFALTLDNVGDSTLGEITVTRAGGQRLGNPFALSPGQQKTIRWTDEGDGEPGEVIGVVATGEGGAILNKQVSTDPSVPVPDIMLNIDHATAEGGIEWCWLTINNNGTGDLTEVTATFADGGQVGEPFALPAGRHKTINWPQTGEHAGGELITVTASAVSGTPISSQIGTGVGTRVAALTVSVKSTRAPRRELAGTTWQFDTTESTAHFSADGKVAIKFGHGEEAQGNWKLEGSWLEFDANGFTTYEVTVEGDRMTGIWRRVGEGPEKGITSVTTLTEISPLAES